MSALEARPAAVRLAAEMVDYAARCDVRGDYLNEITIGRIMAADGLTNYNTLAYLGALLSSKNDGARRRVRKEFDAQAPGACGLEQEWMRDAAFESLCRVAGRVAYGALRADRLERGQTAERRP